MKRLLFAVLAAAALAPAARAAVSLATTTPTNSPISVNAGQTSVPVNVFIFSDTTTDRMQAWQVHLVIAPDGGATGTLSFATPATANPSPAPASYIFGNPSTGVGIEVMNTNMGTDLRADDFDNPPGANVAVPMANRNLLTVTFAASANAGGSFGLFAVQGDTNTAWTDNAPSTQFFATVPNGISQSRIGTVLVPVPEPGLTTAVLLAGAGLAGAGRRLRRRGR